MAAKVLIVEDTPQVREMYARALAAGGFEVLAADDGDKGVEMAKADQPQAILMDVMMPRMNGLDALQAIKADPATKAIPVVMLSAYDDPQLFMQALNLGANRFLVKSAVDPAEVIATLNSVIADAAGQKPAAAA